MKIQLKRVYEAPSARDGVRILVERLWPRGIKKEDLPMEDWVKEAAPSTELRKWFSHDVSKWKEFQKKYISELKQKPEALKPIIDQLEKGKTVTLLYSSKDREHNNAVCLKDYLEFSYPRPL